MFRVAFHQNRQQHWGLVGKTRHNWSEAKISILILTGDNIKKGKIHSIEMSFYLRHIKAGTTGRLVL